MRYIEKTNKIWDTNPNIGVILNMNVPKILESKVRDCQTE